MADTNTMQRCQPLNYLPRKFAAQTDSISQNLIAFCFFAGGVRQTKEVSPIFPSIFFFHQLLPEPALFSSTYFTSS